MKQEESMKSLKILIDENLKWKEHFKNSENKFATNIGFLYKAKPPLNGLYHSYILAYINYSYIAWVAHVSQT